MFSEYLDELHSGIECDDVDSNNDDNNNSSNDGDMSSYHTEAHASSKPASFDNGVANEARRLPEENQFPHKSSRRYLEVTKTKSQNLELSVNGCEENAVIDGVPREGSVVSRRTPRLSMAIGDSKRIR